MSRLAIALTALALLAPATASADGDGLPVDLRTQDGRAPRTPGDVARATGRYTGQLGKIGAGVTLAGVARGAIKGDADAVQDALGEPLTPEFLVGITLFDASMRGAGAALNKAVPIEGRVANALKGNLAMAAAITVVSAVDVDLNGFTYGDLVDGELGKLKDASIGLRDVSAEDVATTAGVFAGVGAIWSGVKRGAVILGKKVGERFLKTAALKGALAVAPVPGSRIAAIGLTAADVVLGVADLAILLTAGGLVEEEVREVRAEQKAESAIEQARQALEQAAQAGDHEAFAEALARTAGAYDEERNRHFMPLAMEDLALVRRLRHDGADGQELNELAEGVFNDYGNRLALPAQTAALLERYGKDHPGHVERQQERAKDAAEGRARDYAAEAAMYRRLKAETTDLALREALEHAAQEAEALQTLENELFARIAKPTFAGRVETARTSLSEALDTTAEDWDD